MLAHSFCMGTATVFFETAASALFLAQYDAETIPYVYLAASAVSIIAGLVFTRLKERVAFAPMMVGVLGLLLAMVTLLRLGLSLSGAAGLIFTMMVAYRLLSILTDLEYWAVATRLYDVQQSKRLFSLIGSGEVTARIAGAFSVPLLVHLLGVANLFWLSALGLGACVALLVTLVKTFPEITARTTDDANRGTAKTKPKDANAVGALLGSGYLRAVFLLAFFAVLGKYFVDFAFLSQMQSRWREVENLASFFGVFSGVTQVVNLGIRVLLSGRLLTRFGIQVGLLLLPAAHFLCTLGIIAAASVPLPVAIFWLAISNQGLYKTLKHPIDNPSFKVLYQPLPRRERLGAQIGVEVIVTPIAIAIASAVMLVAQGTASTSFFSYVMAANFVGWCIAAVFAFRGYGKALKKALEKKTLDRTSFSIEDSQSIALIQQRLRSEHAGDVIFALDLLERINHPGLDKQWLDLLAHPSADVRRYVLLQIEKSHPVGVTAAVERTVDEDGSPRVRAAALRALAALGDPNGRVSRHLGNGDRIVERGALIGLHQTKDESLRELARQRIEELAGSSEPLDRQLAARVLGETGWSNRDLIGTLLRDPDIDVRRTAMRAAGHQKDSPSFPTLIEHLAAPRYKDAAAKALNDAGESAEPALAEALLDETLSCPVRTQVARLVGRKQRFTGVDALWNAYRTHCESLRRESLTSLSALGYRVPASRHEAVLERIDEEVKEAAWELGVLRDLNGAAGFGPLTDSVENEIRNGRERIFYLLSFVHDPGTILSARDHMTSGSREKRAYAAELLEVSLSQELKEKVLPLLDDLSPAEKLRRLGKHLTQPERPRLERLREILDYTKRGSSAWTRACAIYASGSLRSSSLLPELAGLRNNPNLLIAQTANWATERLLSKPHQGENGDGDKTMLTIEKVILLKSVAMFQETSEEILADVAGVLEELELRPGEIVFDKGAPGDSMYIIASGRVRVFDGEKTVNFLEEREIFGELALLDPEPRSASVEAAEETRLFRLDRDTLFELMADNIGVVSGIMQVLCRRLRRMTTIAMGVPK